MPRQMRRPSKECRGIPGQDEDPSIQLEVVPSPCIGFEEVASNEPRPARQEDLSIGKIPPRDAGWAFWGPKPGIQVISQTSIRGRLVLLFFDLGGRQKTEWV